MLRIHYFLGPGAVTVKLDSCGPTTGVGVGTPADWEEGIRGSQAGWRLKRVGEGCA